VHILGRSLTMMDLVDFNDAVGEILRQENTTTKMTTDG
jgi:hypothetical protein